MKKIFLFFLMLFWIVVAWCVNKEEIIQIKQQNNLLQQQINNQKTTQSNDAFEKKKECGSIEFDNDIKTNRGKFANQYKIDEVFYSPHNNTCIWIVTFYDDNDRSVWLYDILSKDWFLDKFYNGDWNCIWPNDKDWEEICIRKEKIFNDRIERLKWE